MRDVLRMFTLVAVVTLATIETAWQIIYIITNNEESFSSVALLVSLYIILKLVEPGECE